MSSAGKETNQHIVAQLKSLAQKGGQTFAGSTKSSIKKIKGRGCAECGKRAAKRARVARKRRGKGQREIVNGNLVRGYGGI